MIFSTLVISSTDAFFLTIASVIVFVFSFTAYFKTHDELRAVKEKNKELEKRLSDLEKK